MLLGVVIAARKAIWGHALLVMPMMSDEQQRLGGNESGIDFLLRVRD